MASGRIFFVLFLSTFSILAHADWLDSTAQWMPNYNWEVYVPTHNGGFTSTTTLNSLKAADVGDYFVARADRLGRTQAGYKQLFDQYMGLSLRMKHMVFEHEKHSGHGYPIFNELASRHYYKSPKDFAQLLWTYKYADTARGTGSTAGNLLKALPPEARKAAIRLVTDSAKATDSIDRGISYTVNETGWRTFEKDKMNMHLDLKIRAFGGKAGIPYRLLDRMNLGSEIDKVDMEMAEKYDVNHSGILSNLGKETPGEVGEMEARGNYARNDAVAALGKFIIAEISGGSPEQALAIFLTLHAVPQKALLEQIEPKLHANTLALLLDAAFENMQNPENPQMAALATGALAEVVGIWIQKERHAGTVAKMLPLMKYRQILLKELKNQPGIDWQSPASPYTYLEPMAQEWGAALFGKSFKLDSATPVRYDTLLENWAGNRLNL